MRRQLACLFAVIVTGLCLAGPAQGGFITLTASWNFTSDAAGTANPTPTFSNPFGWDFNVSPLAGGSVNGGTPSNYSGASGTNNYRIQTNTLLQRYTVSVQAGPTTNLNTTATITGFNFGSYSGSSRVGDTFTLYASKDNANFTAVKTGSSSTTWSLKNGALSSSPNLTIAANETVYFRLDFLATQSGSGTNGASRIDDVTITMNAVPEPSALLLGLIGCVTLVTSQRRRTRPGIIGPPVS